MFQVTDLIRCGLGMAIGGAMGEVLLGPDWAALSGIVTAMVVEAAYRRRPRRPW